MIRLKNILFINAASSGATALLLIFFSGSIAELFGVSKPAPFIGIGIFLLLFAGYVFFQSRKEPLIPQKIQLIIGIDLLWVVGSLIIILPGLFELFMIGYILIGVVALWVATMAFLQSYGLKKLA